MNMYTIAVHLVIVLTPVVKYSFQDYYFGVSKFCLIMFHILFFENMTAALFKDFNFRR